MQPPIVQEQATTQSWLKTTLAIVMVVVVAGLATTLAELARLYLVEPEALAQRCMAGDQSWQCTLREWLVRGFVNNVFGIASIIVGLLAMVSRWRTVAMVAMVIGITGAVLYRFELSGLGILLGALTLVSMSNKKQSD
jgi:hypothetical protein